MAEVAQPELENVETVEGWVALDEKWKGIGKEVETMTLPFVHPIGPAEIASMMPRPANP